MKTQKLLPIPCSDYEYLWDDYQSIAKVFAEAGFNNVKVEPIYDLAQDDWLISDGEFKEILVDGSASFTAGAMYPPDVEILITYHAIGGRENDGRDC